MNYLNKFILILALVPLALSQEYSYEAVAPEDFEWQDSPISEGVKNASLLGDLSSEGLYVSIGEIPEGAVFPAHTHSDDRVSSVVSGIMYYGVGEVFEETDFSAYPAGSVIFTPAGTPHFMWAQDGNVTVQEMGYGPSSAEFIEETQ